VIHHEAGSLDRGLRALVAERNLHRLRSKWPDALARRDPAGPAAARVDRAALHAEGRRLRALILGEPAAAGGLIGELRSLPAGVTVLAEAGSPGDPEPLGRLGCDIIQGPLHEHLKTPEVLYDAVIVRGSPQMARDVATVREEQPQAAVIHDARGEDDSAGADPVDHVVTENGCDWGVALAQAKSRRAHEYV
jgi:hypothetical protein